MMRVAVADVKPNGVVVAQRSVRFDEELKREGTRRLRRLRHLLAKTRNLKPGPVLAPHLRGGDGTNAHVIRNQRCLRVLVREQVAPRRFVRDGHVALLGQPGRNRIIVVDRALQKRRARPIRLVRVRELLPCRNGPARAILVSRQGIEQDRMRIVSRRHEFRHR